MSQNVAPLKSHSHLAKPSPAVVVGLSRAEALWRALEERFVVSPYQRFDWVKAYAGSHAVADADLMLVPIESAGTIIAALPLLMTRRFGLVIAQMPSSDIGNTDFLMIDPARAGEVKAAAIRTALDAASHVIGRLDLVLLRNQPKRLGGISNPLLDFPHQEAPDFLYLSEARPGTERLSSKRLRNLQRGRRRLEELLGPVRLRRARTVEEAEHYHAAFLEQRGQRFRQQGIRNVFAEDRFRSLFRDGVTASLASERPALGLHALMAGDTIVATCFGTYGRTHYSQYINSITEGPAARFSLMGILLHDLVEELGGQGIQSFDMGIGAFDYKTDWTEQTPVFDGMIALSSAGHFLGRAMMAERAARRRIKTDPRLWSLAKRLRSRWTSFLGGSSGQDIATKAPLDTERGDDG